MTAAALPAILSAFLASFVEVVEALTVVLAVVSLRGWRPAIAGTFASLATLAAIVLALGPLLSRVPLGALQVTIGVLLLLFGLGWLRKASLRAAGVIALHDEDAILASTTAELGAEVASRKTSQDWIAGMTAYNAVLLEGLEVVFIVIAVGAGRGLLLPAGIGAAGACVVVLTLGAILQKPLSRVPQNTLKFIVGVMLSTFGVFWTGEGLGVTWPGGDLALLAIGLLFLGAAVATSVAARRMATV
ncbi:MAG TPA: hypothetical protein VJ476_02865 [Rhizomicrobium sp.]|nr:hypothetical protein [Rhizomicrobium sp.]